MKKTTLSRLVAEINEDLHREIKIAAIKEGVSMKDVIEKSLVNYLSHRNKNQKSAA